MDKEKLMEYLQELIGKDDVEIENINIYAETGDIPDYETGMKKHYYTGHVNIDIDIYDGDLDNYKETVEEVN